MNIAEMLVQMETMLERATGLVESTLADEYVGTAADELVTATIAHGRTTIGLHVLAKRRLDREELAAAIVEAVHAAELQSQQAFTAVFEDDHGIGALSPRAQALFRETMTKLRSQLPF